MKTKGSVSVYNGASVVCVDFDRLDLPTSARKVTGPAPDFED